MPCEAHSLATARPTPDAAPVIKAFLPVLNTDILMVLDGWQVRCEGNEHGPAWD